MKNFYFLILAFVCLIFSGCATKNAFLLEQYEFKKLNGSKLLIISLSENAIISNKDDVTDDLGDGDVDKIYNAFFEQSFISSLIQGSSFKEINFLKTRPNFKLSENELEIDKGNKLKILTPDKGKIIDSLKYDFILFIDSLDVSRIAGQSGTFIGSMHTGGSFPELYHKINFVIWDNRDGSIVSFGRVHSASTIPFGMTRSSWEEVIKGLAVNILEYSPFPNKYPKNTSQY